MRLSSCSDARRSGPARSCTARRRDAWAAWCCSVAREREICPCHTSVRHTVGEEDADRRTQRSGRAIRLSDQVPIHPDRLDDQTMILFIQHQSGLLLDPLEELGQRLDWLSDSSSGALLSICSSCRNRLPDRDVFGPISSSGLGAAATQRPDVPTSHDGRTGRAAGRAVRRARDRCAAVDRRPPRSGLSPAARSAATQPKHHRDSQSMSGAWCPSCSIHWMTTNGPPPASPSCRTSSTCWPLGHLNPSTTYAWQRPPRCCPLSSPDCPTAPTSPSSGRSPRSETARCSSTHPANLVYCTS